MKARTFSLVVKDLVKPPFPKTFPIPLEFDLEPLFLANFLILVRKWLSLRCQNHTHVYLKKSWFQNPSHSLKWPKQFWMGWSRRESRKRGEGSWEV